MKWETLLPETLRSPDDLVFCFMDNKCVNGRLSRGNTVAGISHDLSNISMILHDFGWGNLAWPLPRVSLCLTTTCIDRCSLAMSCSHKTSRFNLYNRGRVRTAPRLLAHYATHQNPTSLRPIFVQSSKFSTWRGSSLFPWFHSQLSKKIVLGPTIFRIMSNASTAHLTARLTPK